MLVTFTALVFASAMYFCTDLRGLLASKYADKGKKAENECGSRDHAYRANRASPADNQLRLCSCALMVVDSKSFRESIWQLPNLQRTLRKSAKLNCVLSEMS